MKQKEKPLWSPPLHPLQLACSPADLHFRAWGASDGSGSTSLQQQKTMRTSSALHPQTTGSFLLASARPPRTDLCAHLQLKKKKKTTLLPARRGGLPLVLASSMTRAEILSVKHSSRAQNVSLDIFLVRRVLWLEGRPHSLDAGIGRSPIKSPILQRHMGGWKRRLSGQITTQTLRFELGSRSPAVNTVAAVLRRVHSSSSRRPASPVCHE